MAIPDSFLALTTHHAPGLHFPPHECAGCDEYVLPAPHFFGAPATQDQVTALRERTAACPSAQRELLEFYSRWNGVELCCAPDPPSGEPTAALTILPLGLWDEYTAELTGDLAWMFEGLSDMYVPGRFIAIALSPSEGTRLILFLEGEFEGIELAGRIFYASMDPVLGFTEPVAESFMELLDHFARDPAAFLERIGFTSTVCASGQMYGSVADQYLADCGLTLNEDLPPAPQPEVQEPDGGNPVRLRWSRPNFRKVP